MYKTARAVARFTVGLDLAYKLIANTSARVHHGRGQHTAFGL